MKLVRFGPAGAEQPGVIDPDGAIRNLSARVDDIDPTFLASQAFDDLRSLDLASLPEVGGSPRLGPPVAGVGKFLCIGLNYRRHAAETGAEPPEEPILFLKANSAIAGPNDPITLPRGSQKGDWEVELGIVIGRKAQYIGAEDALDYVAGYCVANDVSERAFQIERGGQWTKGKSCDGFGPIGPWLVTRDEIPNPQVLGLWLDVNGVRRQESNTSDMIFSCAEIVSYLSGFMTLHPGDLIITGTPEGVGLGFDPPVFLKPGDVVSLGIEGLGEQRQEVRAAD